MNEPVAWMMKAREPSLHCPDYVTFEKPTRDMKISHHPYPLYTHPAKELDEQFKKGFEAGSVEGWKAHKFLYPAKTLTDEEIYSCFHQYFVLGKPKPTHYELEYEDLIEFARAILRKAQEK